MEGWIQILKMVYSRKTRWQRAELRRFKEEGEEESFPRIRAAVLILTSYIFSPQVTLEIKKVENL
jgi:hypothetical protein